jgi:tricorn protease
MLRALACSTLLLALLPGPGSAQVDARMFQQPDVSGTHIAFVYAGDIWVVAKEGGVASRLSSPPGAEGFPRFSPDGQRIAYSANYDGNMDVYVVDAMGGDPVRITHHPMTDRIVGWYPDGERLLIASGREAGRQRYNQFFAVSADGGLPEKLPVPYGEFADFTPDGGSLAYMPKSRDFRTWKRYRGGWASDIWLFDLTSYEAENLTDHDAVDGQPMFHGSTLYFLSDRGVNQRHNIWARDMGTGEIRQVTEFSDYDVTFPAIGPSDLVFQAGGTLYRMALPSERVSPVDVEVITDRETLRPRNERVGNLIASVGISPTGQRAVFEARGEVFTVPAEHGPIRNLTRTSGYAERYPAWSPDGRWIAYFSDESGEYELTLRAADGTGEERVLTSLGEGYRYQPVWSPDSEKIAFIDHMQVIRIVDVESGSLTRVDRTILQPHPALQNFDMNWSADGSWLTYSKALDSSRSAVFLYDVENERLHQATSGYYNDALPVFDPDGQYLYFYTQRSLQPVYSSLDGTWIYPNSTRVAAVALREDVASPVAPRSDEEPVEDESADERGEGEGDAEEAQESAEEEPLRIDLGDFERRLVLLPPEAGNYGDLAAVSGKVVYQRRPRSGSSSREAPIVVYDLEAREESTVLGNAQGFQVSANGEKLIVAQQGQFAIIDLRPEQRIEDRLRTAELETTVDPRAEWQHLFTDTWRRYRDFFYDEDIHQVDWDEMRTRYGRMLDDAVTRWDVSVVIGELIGETSAGHTYVGGGDTEESRSRNVGLLGIDWALENGAYRIARIVEGAPWDNEARSPFSQPGVDVDAGDYILAVNGVPLDTSVSPYAAFQGMAGETVALTVNDGPSMVGARDVLVEALTSETRLRHLEWIEQNRQRVAEASGGRVGYVYMPNTGGQGQTELVRQYYAQIDKEGFVIDERFNSGGQLADRFIELLTRKRLYYIGWRNGPSAVVPAMAADGPKVMLINGWSVSGGDAFPWAFKNEGVGPIVGTRTTGALVGPATGHQLIDGGGITVPDARLYDPSGTWFAEGHGVEPDIHVIDDPTQLARGVDPQLEAAVAEALRLLEAQPVVAPDRPDYEDRTARGLRARRTGGSRE